MKVAVLIPAYNEEESIAKVVTKSFEQADQVIVCDDGSSDMTGKIAARLGAKVIRHERNLGYGASLSSLFMTATQVEADVFVTLDADDQHDPAEIPMLVAPLANGEADIAVGSRFLGKGTSIPRYRSVGIKVITNVSNSISKADLSDAQSGFRAYTSKVMEAVIPSDMGMGASVEILMKASRAGLRIAEVPIVVSYQKRAARNPFYHGVEVIFTSIKHLSIIHPLLVYGVPGFALMAYGLYLGYNALRAYEITRHVIIGTTLIAMGGILVGLILCITALILWIMITLIRDPQYRNARITQ